MTRSTAEEDGDFKRSLEALVERIRQFDCGAPKPTEEEAREFAAWIFERHKEKDVEPSLRWFQEERKIEQSYFALFLTLWIGACAALLAASATALTLPITIVCATLVTFLSLIFGFAIRKSMQAQTYRHFQLSLLASAYPQYRPWGFDWRFKYDKDRGHRKDDGHRLVFMCVYIFICAVVVASWIFPFIAWWK